MSSFMTQLDSLAQQVESLLADPHKQVGRAMPCATYFLDGGQVLALPRDAGDSRYPFGHHGFNFWAYASGYMHCNEGLFSLFLRAAEGQEPNTAFFAALPSRTGPWQPLPLLNVPRMDAPPRTTVTRYCILSPTAAWYLTRCNELLLGLRVFRHRQQRHQLHARRAQPRRPFAAAAAVVVLQPVPPAPALRER